MLAWTSGWSRNRCKSFTTVQAAWESWHLACRLDAVEGPLAPQLIFKRVISQDEAERCLLRARLGPEPAEPPRAAADNVATDDDDKMLPEPPAWIVLRGLRPGVYYNR